MEVLKWFVGPTLTLLIAGITMAIAWGKMKQKICAQHERITELKKQIRNDDGSPNFVPVGSCDKIVARLEDANRDIRKKQEYHNRLLTNIAVKLNAPIPQEQ